jgi:hypothetical protein
MKLVILVPSPDYVKNAGARIRYRRLSESLKRIGIELSLTPIDSFDPLKTSCDVVLVSKCYDARALVAAVAMSRRGVSVGIDLFDDYFSEESDGRLSRYRGWLRQILHFSDFALCSTPVLARLIRQYRPEVPIHVLGDSAAAFAPDHLAKTLKRKSAEASSNGVIRACWFGIGDNPYFPVGLSDVAAFGGVIEALASGGMAVELTVVTNRRALIAVGLARLGELPLPVKVEEWSEQKERELLDQSFVCFLPVSAQPFSIAKSSNRAVTALTAGCQVLSAGFPLYAEFDDWIYREPESLVRDLGTRQLRFSPASIPAFEAKIGEIASAEREASSLSAFLAEISKTRSDSGGESKSIALLHGSATSLAAHEAVKRIGGISVATPFCSMPLEFDAVVKLGSCATIALFVAESGLPKLERKWQRQAAAQRLGRRKLTHLLGDSVLDGEGDGFALSLPLQLALYHEVIERSSSMISEAFGIETILLSEDLRLPLETAV